MAGSRRGRDPSLGLNVVWFGPHIEGDLLAQMHGFVTRVYSRYVDTDEPIRFEQVTERVHNYTFVQESIRDANIVVNGTVYHPATLARSELSYLGVESAMQWNHRFAAVAHAMKVPYVLLSNGMSYASAPPLERSCGLPTMPLSNDLALVYWRMERDALNADGYVFRVPEIFDHDVPNPLSMALDWDYPKDPNGKDYKQRVSIPQQITAMGYVKILTSQLYTLFFDIFGERDTLTLRNNGGGRWDHVGKVVNLGHTTHEVYSWGDLILHCLGNNIGHRELVPSGGKEPNVYFEACEELQESSLMESALYVSGGTGVRFPSLGSRSG